MKAINEMTLTFISRSANESFARAAVASFFVQLDPTVEEMSDIKTAISEAVTNAIVHGYRDSLGKVQIHARIYPDNRIYIRIKDSGCGISNIEQAMEPLFTTCNTGERAGLGFAVMQSFMDKVKVRSTPGKGTTVILTKKFSSKQQDA
ncbi:MAG: anti-sigma F factor [Oscillospiraceae bacterium]